MADIHVLIVGAGAVGLGLAGNLLHAGAQVTLLARPKAQEKLSNDGLSVSGIFGKHQFAPAEFDVVSRPEELILRHFDYILVCVKAFSTEATLLTLMPHLSETTRLRTQFMMCQNGLGTADIAADLVADRSQVNSARIITGFERTALNETKVTVHAADLLFGNSFGSDVHALTPFDGLLARGFLPARVKPDIHKDVLAKLLFNLSLNPLGALLNMTYGQIAASTTATEIIRRMLEEAFGAFRANDLRTYWDTAEGYFQHLMNEEIPETSAHRSSMLQDINQSRPTEIDFICGTIVKLAAAHSLHAPTCRTIQLLVKTEESKSRMANCERGEDG